MSRKKLTDGTRKAIKKRQPSERWQPVAMIRQQRREEVRRVLARRSLVERLRDDTPLAVEAADEIEHLREVILHLAENVRGSLYGLLEQANGAIGDDVRLRHPMFKGSLEKVSWEDVDPTWSNI